MSIEFETAKDSTTLRLTGRGGDVLHESTHKTKSRAARHLGRLRGVLRDKKAGAVFTESLRTGDGPIDDAIDEHQTSYAILECLEVLNQAPQTKAVLQAYDVLNDVLEQHTGSRAE